MPDLPTGTVTFLFTDIEGSTRLWEQHTEAMRLALRSHDRLLAETIAQHDGYVVRSRGEGDSFFAVFARATDAVAAALDAQQALQDEPWSTSLRVRMALHTGEADQRDGGYYGSEVNRCARLRAVAHGGQVLLSRSTYDLARDRLPEGVSLLDLGERRLKDLIRPEHVYQLLHPELPAEFPPLKMLDTHAHNLQVQPTPLLGREREVAAVKELLPREEVRLVTLTGPGGTGKTRLGLQIAADLVDEFQDGAFFVDLAPLSDPALVAATIAQVLDVQIGGSQPLTESLKQYLRHRQLLLLLDNFEQLLPAAPLVAELLAVAPQLKVLVTSRAVLRVRGEHEFPVPPLAASAAIELFVQQAVAVKPDFIVTDENAPVVAEVCERLEGLPLAIELAAARIKLFPPEALLSRLENRLKLLTSGARDLPTRQQTLRGAIDWSYELLDEAEKTLFRCLSVFAGGCTLEAAEAVCKGEGELGMDIIDGMEALVSQSLLRQQAVAGEPRFSMLETIREFGRDTLGVRGEADAVRRRHAEFFLRLAEAAEPHFLDADQSMWLQRIEADLDNVRAALEWSLVTEEAELGLRLAEALQEFWIVCDHEEEGQAWLEQLLSRSARVSPVVRAKALLAAGLLSCISIEWSRSSPDHFEASCRFCEESLALFHQLGDRWGIAYSLHVLGNISFARGDNAYARSLQEESLALRREIDDKRDMPWTLRSLAQIAWSEGDYHLVRSLSEEALAVAQEVGCPQTVAWQFGGLAALARHENDLESARTLFEKSLSYLRKIGGSKALLGVLDALGHVTEAQGDYAAAHGFLYEYLATQRRKGDRAGIAHGLGELAKLAEAEGNLDRAARLLGAVEGLLGPLRASLHPTDSADHEQCLARVRSALGEDPFTAALAQSQAMTLEQAIRYALGDDALD